MGRRLKIIGRNGRKHVGGGRGRRLKIYRKEWKEACRMREGVEG